MGKTHVLLLAAALFWAGATAATAGVTGVAFKLIVNEANSISYLSRDEVQGIFMGKMNRWSNGDKVEPVDLPADSVVRKSFSEAVLGKPVTAVQSYWQRQIFSGKGVPPSELASDREVVSFVKRTAGAVGYVSESTAVEGVKVLPLQ